MKKVFVIDLKYLVPIEQVDTHLKDHREYLGRGYEDGTLLMSGRKDPLTGGVIIGTFSSVWDAKDFMKNDPFIINKVAEYKVTEFTPVKYHEDFKGALGVADLKAV